ncbi:MAG TPA: chorismate mutase [Gemmatimonadaceae bacterium]|nr:chorismate mutase [Gemmatimonadaceae bacterium]
MTTSPELGKLREQIEAVDHQLIQLIAERVALARQVGVAKRATGMATLDHVREAAVVRRAVTIARDAGLTCDDEIRQIFWQLIGLSRRAQTED